MVDSDQPAKSTNRPGRNELFDLDNFSIDLDGIILQIFNVIERYPVFQLVSYTNALIKNLQNCSTEFHLSQVPNQLFHDHHFSNQPLFLQ
jgi:hypothetical protein